LLDVINEVPSWGEYNRVFGGFGHVIDEASYVVTCPEDDPGPPEKEHFWWLLTDLTEKLEVDPAGDRIKKAFVFEGMVWDVDLQAQRE
jgi:hypothetical protein